MLEEIMQFFIHAKFVKQNSKDPSQKIPITMVLFL